MPISAALAVLLAAAAAAGAAASGALTADGAVAATGVGALTLAAGGPAPSALLLLFFVSSSALSRLPGPPSPGRGARRNAAQVVANGGVPALAALLSAIPALHAPAGAALAGALAAATSDTWSSEVGRRSRSAAFHVRLLAPVPGGTSGAVTLPGSAAGAAGALLMGIAASVVSRDASLLLPVAAGGVAGNLADTLLGAWLQERRRCSLCGGLSELTVHPPCAAPTVPASGISGLDNDAVNLLASLAGALAAAVLFR